MARVRNALVGILAMVVTGFDARTAHAQEFLPGTFQLTQYWVASEAPGANERHAVRLTDRQGSTLAWACGRFASNLAMEGTGRTWDGRILNWETRQGRRACFTEVDTGLYPYGIGVRGYALVPFRSLAVDTRYIRVGHTVEIPELIGLPLPAGGTHDGCFVAVDGGGAIRGHHIDLFVSSRGAWSALGRGGWLPERVHAVVDSSRCAYARRFAVIPLPDDPVGLVTSTSLQR